MISPGDMQEIYQEIVGQLKGTNEKLWQSVCTRLCRSYLEKQMYKELDAVSFLVDGVVGERSEEFDART